MVPYNDMKNYTEAVEAWAIALREYFEKLPVDEAVDIGSNPPPPPPPPPGS